MTLGSSALDTALVNCTLISLVRTFDLSSRIWLKNTCRVPVCVYAQGIHGFFGLSRLVCFVREHPGSRVSKFSSTKIWLKHCQTRLCGISSWRTSAILFIVQKLKFSKIGPAQFFMLAPGLGGGRVK